MAAYVLGWALLFLRAMASPSRTADMASRGVRAAALSAVGAGHRFRADCRPTCWARRPCCRFSVLGATLLTTGLLRAQRAAHRSPWPSANEAQALLRATNESLEQQVALAHRRAARNHRWLELQSQCFARPARPVGWHRRHHAPGARPARRWRPGPGPSHARADRRASHQLGQTDRGTARVVARQRCHAQPTRSRFRAAGGRGRSGAAAKRSAVLHGGATPADGELRSGVVAPGVRQPDRQRHQVFQPLCSGPRSRWRRWRASGEEISWCATTAWASTRRPRSGLFKPFQRLHDHAATRATASGCRSSNASSTATAVASGPKANPDTARASTAHSARRRPSTRSQPRAIQAARRPL